MLKRISLRGKLLLVLGMLSAVAITISYIGITRLSGLNDQLNQIVEVVSTRQYLAARITQDLLAIHRAEKNLILAQTQEDMDRYEKAKQQFEKAMEEKLAKLEAIASEEGKKQIVAFRVEYGKFKEIDAKVCDASRRNTNLQAFELSKGTGRDLFDKAAECLSTVCQNNDGAVSETIAEMKKAVADEVKAKLGQVDDASTRATLSAQCVADFIALQRAEKNLILSTDTAEMDRYAKVIEQTDQALRQKVEKIKATATDEGKRLLAAFEGPYAAWLDNHKKVRALSLENSNELARQLSCGDGRKAFDAAEAAMQAIADLNDKAMNETAAESDRSYAVARTLMLTISIAGILCSVVLCLVIIQGLVRALSRIIAALGDGSQQVASASGMVSSASQSLAQGTSEQAAAIEETSSSIEEMASMTKQNAGNAGEAKNLAANAQAGAARGGEAMAKMGAAIDDIKKSSDETAKIIKTIDEIAFQTNLLALNAAVEAARAGEAGKGFAVVAEEVRNLAQRSAEAAKNTANMIDSSVRNADNGVEISREASASFEEIAEGIRKVNELVGEIAAASNEQAQGIEQVSTAVGQMDQVTQQNAANAEESASASEELSAQAEELRQMVLELQRILRGQTAAAFEEAPRSQKSARAGAGLAFAADKPAKCGTAKPAKRQPKQAPAAAARRDGKNASAREGIPLEEKELSSF